EAYVGWEPAPTLTPAAGLVLSLQSIHAAVARRGRLVRSEGSRRSHLRCRRRRGGHGMDGLGDGNYWWRLREGRLNRRRILAGGAIQGFNTGAASLDPVANTTYRAQWMAGFHYARLFRFNAAEDPKVTLSREPIPDLVGGYEVTPDGLTYTMKLRQGVTFHPPL